MEFVAALARGGEPGLAVGVYRDGELAGSATAGCAVPEHGVLVSEHTMFDIASVSKHTTSACLLLLARDGLVDLESDIRSVLPELSLGQPVTLRQCLTHTAGLRDYFALSDIAGLPVMGITESQFMNLVAGQRELDFAAGSAFSYSNTGYVLAAAVVRRITGAGLAVFAKERVFAPLGMNVTHFRDDVSLLVPHLANGYLAGPAESGFRRCDVTEEIVGDGAIVTSLADLAGWHSFMASGAVLGTDIRDGLLARQMLTDGSRIGYALGLESVDVGGSPAWWHSGSWAGYRAAVIYLPDLRAGVSVLANRNDRFASHVALAVASALVTGENPRSCYERLAGVAAPPGQAVAPAADIAGLWHEPDQDVFIQLEAAGSEVRVREQDEEYSYLLGADGRWHGRGVAAGGSYGLQGGTLIAGWGLSARPEGRYQRVRPHGGSERPLSAGIFRNEELRAYAEVSVGESGAPGIVIGLAPARALQPAGPGLWRSSGNQPGGALTVRVTSDGSALLISAAGARHVRFDICDDTPADRAVLRGLTAAE